MSYPATKFSIIYDDVVRATGQPLSNLAIYTQDDQERVAQLINDELRRFWENAFWPGLFAIEQRTLDPVGLFVLKAAANETEIGDIDPMECFYTEEPIPGSLEFVLTDVEDRGDRIVCFDSNCPEAPYIRFMLPVPQFTRIPYAVDETYAAGELVYDGATGEAYKSVQAANIGQALTDTAWWTPMIFPTIARTYIKWACSSEFMAEDSGKYKQAARAMSELERLEDKYRVSNVVGR